MAGNAPRTLAQVSGHNAEQHALRFLRKNGLILITKNFRCRHGEIDLIMRQEQCIVIVEVRYRKHSRFASAAATVDPRKQAKLLRTTAMFLRQHTAYSACSVRFDVVAFDQVQDDNCRIQWIQDAFRPRS
jgi:putative endonuclease